VRGKTTDGGVASDFRPLRMEPGMLLARACLAAGSVWQTGPRRSVHVRRVTEDVRRLPAIRQGVRSHTHPAGGDPGWHFVPPEAHPNAKGTVRGIAKCLWPATPGEEPSHHGAVPCRVLCKRARTRLLSARLGDGLGAMPANTVAGPLAGVPGRAAGRVAAPTGVLLTGGSIMNPKPAPGVVHHQPFRSWASLL